MTKMKKVTPEIIFLFRCSFSDLPVARGFTELYVGVSHIPEEL